MNEPERRCKNCRWYQDPPSELDHLANVKQCVSPKVIHGDNVKRTDHGRILEREDDHHVLSGDEAGLMDGSGYYAALFPAPDFGCVHFEVQTRLATCEVCGHPATSWLRRVVLDGAIETASGPVIIREPGESGAYCDKHKPE